MSHKPTLDSIYSPFTSSSASRVVELSKNVRTTSLHVSTSHETTPWGLVALGIGYATKTLLLSNHTTFSGGRSACFLYCHERPIIALFFKRRETANRKLGFQPSEWSQIWRLDLYNTVRQATICFLGACDGIHVQNNIV